MTKNFMLLPFKVEGDKIVHDNSEKAYIQLAMTLLLSDVEFNTVWPLKMNIQPIMKYIDLICPSIIDILGVLTFGGVSIAARAEKMGIKLASKNSSKKLTQKSLKKMFDLSKKAPKNIQKKVKKMADASKLSRKQKAIFG